MNNWYFKTSGGQYIPVKFQIENPEDWHNKFVVVKIGNSKVWPNENDLDEIMDALQYSDVLTGIGNASFLITPFDVKFEESGISQGRMFIVYDDEE